MRGDKAFVAGHGSSRSADSGTFQKTKPNSNGISDIAADDKIVINRPLSDFEDSSFLNSSFKTLAKFHEAIALLRTGTKNPSHVAYLNQAAQDVDAGAHLSTHRRELSAISQDLGYDILARSIEEI